MDIEGTIKELTRLSYRPTPCLMITWQDEAGLDHSICTLAVTGTGTGARSVAEPPFLKYVLAGPAVNDTARLYSNARWFCNPQVGAANYLKNSILQTLNMEFEFKLATVTSILNTAFFMGLGDAQNVTEASANLIGFGLDGSDDLFGMCNDGTGPAHTGALMLDVADLVNWHTVRMEVTPGAVRFSLDGYCDPVNWIVTADLPNTAMFLNFYLPQEAAASGGELHLGVIRVWTEDTLRNM